MARKSVKSHCFKNVKYYTNKHGWTQTFYQVFKGTGCLHWCARYKQFVVCGQLCHLTARYVMSTGHKICVLSTKLYKRDAFRKDWIWMYVGKYVTFKSVYTCRHCACHTVMSCLVIMRVAGAWVRRKKVYKCDLEAVQILPKLVLLKKLLNHSFMHAALLGVINMNFE